MLIKLNQKAFSDKTFTTSGIFTAKMLGDNEDIITISGYASTNSKDRDGDIIVADAWSDGDALKNYLLNPIVLANHNPATPIGKTVSYEVDTVGLKVTAEISKAAGNIFDLVKQGILKTFSVGFRIKDADWNSALDAFIIKSVELFEISVVSIPANQSAIFSVAKQFGSDDEYSKFKNKFNPTEEPKKMEQKTGIDQTAMEAAIAKAIAANQERLEQKTAAETAIKDRVSGEVKSALERFEEDSNKALDKVSAEKLTLEEAVGKLTADLGEQATELKALRESKQKFSDTIEVVSKDQMKTAIFLAKAKGMGVRDTKFFKEMTIKSGEEHWGAGAQVTDWEQDFSTNILTEVRAQLRVESTFTRAIAMPTASFHLPVNPEAGLSEWVTTANLRGPNSTGTAADHALNDITLVAKKMVAKEYVGYEEEEDSLVAIMPIVMDALARRMARGSDKSFLLGTGSGLTGAANGISGMNDYATALATTLGIGAGDILTVANLTALRASLGLYGLDTAELVYFVSVAEYYNLLEDTNFKTVDLIGDKATLLTGQVGMVGGVPVVVTNEFAAKAAGNAAAMCVNVNNFLKGNLRGMMVESDKDVEAQKKIIVATRRFDLIPITASAGAAKLNYIA